MIKQSSKKKNLGIAFISFKERDCVTDTLEEIELVKQNLMNDKKSMKLSISNWEVQRAYPPSDIIWTELQNISKNQSMLRKLGLFLLKSGVQFGINLAVIYID